MLQRFIRISRYSLPFQMMMALVGLVILTSAAIGLPAIQWMRAQLERQAMDMLEQGGRTVQALLKAESSDLGALALLTAQRPTLRRLLAEGDQQSLSSYLDTLQSGAALDQVVLCRADGTPVQEAATGEDRALCQFQLDAGMGSLPSEEGEQGWLLASQAVEGDSSGVRVVAGRALDADFARSLQEQTGMNVILALDGRFLASSFSSEPAVSNLFASLNPQQTTQEIVTLEDRRYYAARYPTSPDNFLQVWLFFPAETILRSQQVLTVEAGLVILVVVVVGTAFALLGARQFSRPLGALRTAASRLRKGDLSTPIVVRTRLYEVSQAAYALEEARRSLQQTLLHLREEKAWVDHLLESIVEGIITFDRRGRITFFSHGAEQITGWQSDEVLGRALDDIFPLVEENNRFSKRLPEPGRRQKLVVRTKDDRHVTLSVTGGSLAPPEVGRASTVLVLRDVSDEEVIRRLLGEFLANISHEFRTPLSALAASIELLLDQLPDLSPEELHELLDSTRLGILNLQTLIDNLLEGASIETGQFRVYPRRSDLGQIVQDSVQTMTPLVSKYGQTLEVDLPADLPEVKADARRITQVLVNLISNAIKWNAAAGTICLQVVLENEQVRIGVSDQGPGVPELLQRDLFSRFDRGQARALRAETGAGLGLSVVKAIVEAHGGQVGAQNLGPQNLGPQSLGPQSLGHSDQEAGGALFWFTLPLDGQPGQENSGA